VAGSLPVGWAQAGLPRADCRARAGSDDCSVRRWPDDHCGLEVEAAGLLPVGWARGGLPRADCRARAGSGDCSVRRWPDDHCVPEVEVAGLFPVGWAQAGLPRADCSERAGWPVEEATAVADLQPVSDSAQACRLQMDLPLPESESLAWLEAPS